MSQDEYFSRRDVLRTSAALGTFTLGAAYSVTVTEPVLAADGNWSATDVGGVDPIEAILIGDGNLDLTWDGLTNEEQYIEWELEARLTSEGENQGSDEFDAIANNYGIDDSNKYEIPEEDTPSGSDSDIEFFTVRSATSEYDFDMDYEEFDEYESTQLLNIIDEHSSMVADDFNLEDGESEDTTEVELRLTLETLAATTDSLTASSSVSDTFTVTVDEGGETTIDGDAGVDSTA